MGIVEPIGRPLRVLSKEERDQVEALAEYLTQEQIAAHLSMSVDTLARIFERDQMAGFAYHRGKVKAIAEVAENLLLKAKAGDFQSQQFYLRTQAGWSETIQHTSPDGSMSPKAGPPIAIYALPDNGRDKPEPEKAFKTARHAEPAEPATARKPKRQAKTATKRKAAKTRKAKTANGRKSKADTKAATKAGNRKPSTRKTPRKPKAKAKP